MSPSSVVIYSGYSHQIYNINEESSAITFPSDTEISCGNLVSQLALLLATHFLVLFGTGPPVVVVGSFILDSVATRCSLDDAARCHCALP